MKQTIFTLLTFALLLPEGDVLAHPGSGIAVDRQGNVYFVDTGSGVWKIERDGKLTKLSAPAYHWMAFDVDNKLSKTRIPRLTRDGATVTRDSGDPRVIVSSDFPIAVGPDGALYYPWANAEQQVQIFRVAPSGTTSVVITLPPARSATGEIRWRNGINVAADGSIYFTEDRAVKRITPEGKLTTVAGNLDVPGCGSVVGVEPELGAYCRGLDVGADGTVYVAATGCRAVLRITPDGKITTVLQASSPWSPTSVAVHGSDLYVLEYLHTAGDNRREWLPRVRKLSSDGSIITLATIDRQ
jgi:sugar lactone lactonase YvrE